MTVISIETQVVGYLSEAQLWLEGKETKLSYDGNKTRRSTDLVDVTDGVLNVMLHCIGFAGSDWEITINQLQPTKKELYKNGGTIDSTGHSFLVDAVKIKEES